MIVRDVEPLAAAEAARRTARGGAPCWIVSPGATGREPAWEMVACDPGRVVCGADVAALAAAWHEARARWAGAGAGVPIGVGFLSYDLGRVLEPLRVPPATGSSGLGGLEFRFYPALWLREGGGGRCRIVGASADAVDRLNERLYGAGASLGAEGESAPTPALGPFVAPEPAERHLAAVARVLEYIRAGDVYQVNLARRLRAGYHAGAQPPGLDLFTRLQQEAPAPHALWLGDLAGGGAIVGNSPERFLKLGLDGVIETCPIKGTRARGRDAAGDAAVVAELTAAPKDRAEHVMIVDLERNDLGRICRTGSVHVHELMRVLTLPTVHHLVSTVRGRLRAEVGLVEILRAMFPGGSVTGAPKIRAREIIAELEPAERGPYTGATGWLGAAGDFDLAVAIRTAVIKGDTLELWVGGGIVADSDPGAELAETEVKARAFSRLCAAGASGAP